MRKLILADTVRILRSKWFWICLGGMISMAVVFMIMQYTAMDYTVALNRVIFLPMSFYGMAVAALISLFGGEDFGDGFIRNKIIAGHSKWSIYLCNLLVSALACVFIYLIVTVFVTVVGSFYFEINFTAAQFLKYLLMGMAMCIGYACIYNFVTMLLGNKASGVVVCMALAFFMLCACLHTNQVMVQPEFKNGVPNAAYVDGFRKLIYAFIHDFNPSGQAAQLSAMHIFSPVRWILCDALWLIVALFGGVLFKRKNIK